MRLPEPAAAAKRPGSNDTKVLQVDKDLKLPDADMHADMHAAALSRPVESRTTYMASLLVFGAVVSDAAMVERVIGMDVIDAEMAQAAGGRQRGAQGARRPTQQDIEGSGGRFWYEMGM